MLACIALVLGFKASTRLASAYGIAVSGTMAITSVVFFFVTRSTWKWSTLRAAPLLALFLSFDLPFFGANLTKFTDGGYVPILAGAAFFVVMVAWHRGREALRAYMAERTEPLLPFLAGLLATAVTRVPGTAVYLSGAEDGVPSILKLQALRVRSIAEHVVLLTVVIEHEPQIDEGRRYDVKTYAQGFVRVTIRFGYMEDPAVPPVLERAIAAHAIGCFIPDATFYIGRETFISGKGGRLPPVVESLVAFLARNAKSAIDHFGLPPERVVELGTRIDL